MVLAAQDVSPARLSAFGGEQVADGYVAHIDDAQSARRRNWRPASPVAVAELAHDRTLVVIWSKQVGGIHDDHVLVGRNGQFFRGQLAVDVSQLHMPQIEGRIFVKYSGRLGRPDGNDARRVNEPGTRI